MGANEPPKFQHLQYCLDPSSTLLMEIHPIHGPLCLPTRRLGDSYNGGNLKSLNETCFTRETMGNRWFWVHQFEETSVS